MRSDLIKTGADRAPARAMLRATGLDDGAIAKPLVAVVHTWSNVSPCNLNLRELAEHVAEGIRAAGGTPIEFNTIAVTDGIAMVLAVNWPPQAPAPGQASRSTASSSASSIWPAPCAPTASNTCWIVIALPSSVP